MNNKATPTEIFTNYKVSEFTTLTRNGSPVCWPMAPGFEGGKLAFSTGYVYPTKARNAQANPRVAALFSDPTASGRSENDPMVLVQGLAEVDEIDLQRNTDRYVDQIFQKSPLSFRMMLRTPGLRQLFVGYLARIWIEVVPQNEYVWNRTQMPPEVLRTAICPVSFSPGKGIELPKKVLEWLPKYARQPVLAYIDKSGWPAMTRVQAKINNDQVVIESDIEREEGAPACLTYHRLVGNYTANDTFLVRGHFDAAGRLIPEKVVGFVGTQDDRGLGSLKAMRTLIGYRKQLKLQMEKEGRLLPVVRPSLRA